MVSPEQKVQLDEWLRQADKCIREGRYLAADEFLQMTLKLHPESTTARMYQDRMLFLINQLSHRIGIPTEMQSEIRKYRDLQRQRQSNQVNIYLMDAKRLLDSGHFDRAHECLTMAIGIDRENEYAKALLQRLTELRRHSGKDPATEHEFQYRSVLRESWTNGIPSEDQSRIIAATREKLRLSDDRATAIEAEVRVERYRDALHELWTNGGLVGFIDETINQMKQRYGVSRHEHSKAESELLRNVRRDRLLGTVLVASGDLALLNDLVYTLRLKSFTVVGALDVAEAIASLTISRPDVILSTLEFPGGISGFDFFQEIRSRHELKTVPFLFLATGFDRTTQLIGRRLGVDDFVTVPVDYEMLVATLKGKLSVRRKRA
jgi:CheY-like chemotaxis protein